MFVDGQSSDEEDQGIPEVPTETEEGDETDEAGAAGRDREADDEAGDENQETEEVEIDEPEVVEEIEKAQVVQQEKEGEFFDTCIEQTLINDFRHSYALSSSSSCLWIIPHYWRHTSWSSNQTFTCR